jgi:hypothetical protein
VLEKDGEDQLDDRVRNEELHTQKQREEEYPAYNKEKKG